MRYVALGDSSTIGTSVPAAERWPERLADALGPDEPTLGLIAGFQRDRGDSPAPPAASPASALDGSDLAGRAT